jgi:hypothetical protein
MRMMFQIRVNANRLQRPIVLLVLDCLHVNMQPLLHAEITSEAQADILEGAAASSSSCRNQAQLQSSCCLEWPGSK